MAHYIAELIEAARTCPTAEKEAAQERCSKAILELWKYRSAFPDRVRPLIELDPILRTLAALDSEGDRPWYHRQIFQQVQNGRSEDETERWLALATDLDSSARTLIRWILRTVTERIASPTKPWMELAAAAGIDDAVDTAILRVMVEGAEKIGDARIEALKGKLSMLEEFAGMATAFAKDLREEIAAKEGEKDAGTAEPRSTGEELESSKAAAPK
jgi:hypothetical protein